MEYTLRRSRRNKNIRITIKPTREVVVSAPLWVPKFAITSFVMAKESWIQKSLATMPPAGTNPDLLNYSRSHYLKHRESARQLITAKVKQWNQHYQFTYGRIAIKNNRTNWGSCSSKGNLNFNYRILFLAPELQDYIIVHELCHLQEMNHGQKFWQLVAETVPNHKELRTRIRVHDFHNPSNV